jgi:hypothetical protein
MLVFPSTVSLWVLVFNSKARLPLGMAIDDDINLVRNNNLPGPFAHSVAAVGWPQRASPVHDQDDPEIEYSPLCEEITREGLTVRVQVYRLKTGDSGWSLEVIDQEGVSTVWDDLFATDHEALAEFYQTLEAEGFNHFLSNRTRLN